MSDQTEFDFEFDDYDGTFLEKNMICDPRHNWLRPGGTYTMASLACTMASLAYSISQERDLTLEELKFLKKNGPIDLVWREENGCLVFNDRVAKHFYDLQRQGSG